MKIEILRKDILKDTYISSTGCAIARSLKKIMPSAYVSVGPEEVQFGDKNYLIHPADQIILQSMYAYLNPKGWENHIKECGITKPKNFVLELIDNDDEEDLF